jgi:uncharacterized protein YegP (UPF0339 family)
MGLQLSSEEVKMDGKFETKKGKGGFRFNLIAPNGKVILSSETYKSKAGLENGIASVKANARDKSITRSERRGTGKAILCSRQVTEKLSEEAKPINPPPVGKKASSR